VTNPGFNYTVAPTVTITGDGTGATATATIVNGRVQKITVINRGIDYTSALVTISGGDGDGYGATAIAVLDSRFGDLRTVYYDNFAQKQIIREKAGTIDYQNGVITLTDIRILSAKPSDGFIRISLESEKGILSSAKNTIITIDSADPSAIVTELVSV
jgi:hypothetical protein